MYFEQQKALSKEQYWTAKVRPAAVGAALAVVGRIVVAPIMLMLVFASTDYLTTGTFFIEAKDSYFAYNEMDLVMTGGCEPCHVPCRRSLLQADAFNREALKSKPNFESLFTATSWNYSVLSEEALALGDALDASGAICTSGVNEWGSPNIVITATGAEILQVVTVLELSVAPQMLAELKKGIELKNECTTKWAIMALIHLFQFQTVKDSMDYSSIPAADFNVFPEYTECRPAVSNDNIVGVKLALATGGDDLLAVVPELLMQFPYEFKSSLPLVSRTMPAHNTVHKATNVIQSLFHGYYGGCRVREVNTTGVYIEDTCAVIKRWESYGLMIQSPDDIPVCTTSGVCVHNYYNSLWEWVSEIDPKVEGRIAEYINVFRNRYADTVELSVLPGMVVLQMLVMGVVSLYQIMSHKRSVLLTQTWAYRCQNGRMQVLYLAQVGYHLASNSDLYYLGLATGTLTLESLANLTFSFFAFSYSFINLAKARSGEQQLDRYFRLTWETMQVIITTCVAMALFSVRVTSLAFVVGWNGELLRKTTERGATYCGLNDSCILMKVNLAITIAMISAALGLFAETTSFLVQRSCCRPLHLTGYVTRISGERRVHDGVTLRRASSLFSVVLPRHTAVIRPESTAAEPRSRRSIVAMSSIIPFDLEIPLTSFEQYCLGSPFCRLFKDCGDFAYVCYRGKHCTSVEALLLTGYVFYGEHIYPASSVVLLLLARLLPRKLLRTFNVLLMRWHVDPDEGTVSHAQSCTWYHASSEHYWLEEATPVA
ncbi:NADP-dependent alcohol dehydrogenase C 2 [Phytophthora cinnamomi]|uniref:NADP-dependent alcohol dehydrogenase C 2 n=1 Tax=Phytophthora cinnamomi TaxID=4785 RepID=UPI00355A1985|nr:NADP-dependent alcohol dehydrogenase C 2 [Phytophthora cinnamomi]